MQARLHLNAGALIFKHGRVDLMFKSEQYRQYNIQYRLLYFLMLNIDNIVNYIDVLFEGKYKKYIFASIITV